MEEAESPSVVEKNYEEWQASLPENERIPRRVPITAATTAATIPNAEPAAKPPTGTHAVEATPVQQPVTSVLAVP
eukprot:3935183-Rhodomonas_salina.1